METEKQSAYEETTDKDYMEEVFPKGPLGSILGAPKQYESPRQGGPGSRAGGRLNRNGQIFDDDDKTNKAVY